MDTPTYTNWGTSTVAQNNGIGELRFFNLGWVKIWATDAESAEAIARDILDKA